MFVYKRKYALQSIIFILLLTTIVIFVSSCSSKDNETTSSTAKADTQSTTKASEQTASENKQVTSAETTQQTTESTVPKTTVSEKLDIAKAKSVLIDFLTANSLHLKCMVTYKTYDPSVVEPKLFEVWTKGNYYRCDEYLGEAIRFRIIVKDKDAKQYSMATKSVFDPISPPENYTDYYKWDTTKIDEGKVTTDGKYAIFTIDGIDKFYKKEGAKAGYYYTKIEFGVNNNNVIYTTLYGNSSSGEKPTGVNAVTQTYEFVNINEDFDDSVFNAPF